MTEAFYKAGIRTYRIVAIAVLKEIIVRDGKKSSSQKKISINDAIQRDFIHGESEPVISVRAFGTKTRLGEELSKEDVEDAILLVAEELMRDPKKFSAVEYINWLAETIGKNIALMHNEDWVHNYLGLGHNITLDGRIVDLDSIELGAEQNPGKVREEISDAYLMFRDFLDDIGNKFPDIITANQQNNALKIMKTTYIKNVKNKNFSRMMSIWGNSQKE
jgi:hypothetical protein